MISDDRDSSPLLDDQPATVDLLGFEVYAQALSEVIENKQARTPFIVGIFGRWGTGKTTLMRLIERQLKRETTTIWFSAWVYGREDEIWAALLQCLVAQISARLRFIDKIRFAFGIYARGMAWERLLLVVPGMTLRAMAVVAPLILAIAASWLTGVTHDVAAALKSIGLLGSAAVGWQFVKPAFDRLSRGNVFNVSLNRHVEFQQHVGFLEQFREQFARLVASLPKANSRVVIFVDDLDRCEPDKALQLLDTIKVFLDVPGCIFMLGLDVQVIKGALEVKYPRDPLAQREYLSKIVQLPFHLPPPTADDLRVYLQRLAVQFPDDRCGEVFLTSVSNNPREIKRFINTYSLNWYLASAQAGGRITAVRLAKIVVIQQVFEPLYALLRERPEWLALLENGLRGGDRGSRGPSDSEGTVILSASGIAVPPAIEAFLDEPLLKRLLTMHPLEPHRDDANFSMLDGDAIAPYFSVSGRAPDTFASPTNTDSTGSARRVSDEYPDFGTRYQILSRTGMGGVAEVFLADDTTTKRRVAIKKLLPTLASNPEWRERFMRETRMLSKVSEHPNLLNVYDAGGVTREGEPFCVTEAAQGEALDAMLKRSGPLDSRSCRMILMPLFDALDHIHRLGVVHGDIKPGNIIVLTSGVPKLIDFGLAFMEEEARDRLSSPGTVVGTFGYMSPERLMGQAFDSRSDLYSFGAVLYECLTGEKVAKDIATQLRQSSPPAPPSKLNPALRPEVDVVVMRLLAKDPNDRIQTAAEARDLFGAAIA